MKSTYFKYRTVCLTDDSVQVAVLSPIPAWCVRLEVRSADSTNQRSRGEIKQASKKELSLAAEGAVLFLEKLSPTIEEVNGSSGGIGTTVNRAIETLVPIVAKADANQAERQRSLERLKDAVETDEIQCLEGIGNYWDGLCAGPNVASRSADDFMATVASVSSPPAPGHGYFQDTTACFSALHSAGRYQGLFALLETARFIRHSRGLHVLGIAAKYKYPYQYRSEPKAISS